MTAKPIRPKPATEPAPARLIDVANLAKVSRTTAAKVLLNTGGANTRVSEDTTQRVREAAKQLKFQPNPFARRLKGAKSMSIGLLVGGGRAANMLYRILDLEQVAFERGYRVQLAHADGNPERAKAHLEDFEQQRFDGMIGMHLPEHFGKPFFERLRRGGCTVFQGLCHVPGACNVMLDRADGIRQAVEHLAKNGRKRIGIFIPVHAEDQSAIAKLQGYRMGLHEAGLRYDAERVFHVGDLANIPADRLPDGLCIDGLDALICSSDSVAIRLLRPLTQMGVRVPTDLALTGFDNSSAVAWMAPTLTSVDQCDEEVARMTVTRLIDAIESGSELNESQSVVVRPKLIVRESTGVA